jgi:hypothetical protein
VDYSGGLKMSIWNGKVHGDIGQAFERQSGLDHDTTGARQFLLQIVHAWTAHHQDGVIVATRGGGGLFFSRSARNRQFLALEFYSPIRLADGKPAVAITFVRPSSMTNARNFFGPDDHISVLECAPAVFEEVTSHLLRSSRPATNRSIDVRSFAKLYEGMITVFPAVARTRLDTRLSSSDATPLRSGNSSRRCAAEDGDQSEASSVEPGAGTGTPKGWTAVLGCSTQALAMFRVSLGLLLTLELVLRYRFLRPFYSDEGTLPTRLLLDRVDSLYQTVCGLHCQLCQLWQQQVLLTIQAIIAICFTMGIQTRATAIASWYLYLGSTLRNMWMSYILDRYFHYLLFLSMFLPLNGTVFASRRGTTSGWVVSPATIAVKLLVVWIYLDAGYGKLMDPLKGWSFGADPLPALDTYARHTLPAQYLYALIGPSGLRLMTPTVVYVELLAAPVALLGAYLGRAWITNLAVFLICSLHVGIALTLRNAALLSFVACSVWCALLPLGGSTNPRRLVPGHWGGRLVSIVCIGAMIMGSLWLETISQACDQSVKHIWSTLLHNRWNVFVGAEEYVTWEIAPGVLQDGSYVDVWGKSDNISWSLPGGGAPCTATARPGRWRSFPYLAELQGEEGDVLWRYLCREWDRDNRADDLNPGRKLLQFNFFMLQADVLPEMQFSGTRKRLIKSFDCSTESSIDLNQQQGLPDFMTVTSRREVDATQPERSLSEEL